MSRTCATTPCTAGLVQEVDRAQLEPPPAAVGVPPPHLDRVLTCRIGDDRLEVRCAHRAVLGMDEPEEVAADEILGPVAEDVFERGADVGRARLAVDDDDDVGRVADQRAEPFRGLRRASTAASASVVSREFDTMPWTEGTSNMFVKTCSNQRHEPLAWRCRHRTRAHLPGVARTGANVTAEIGEVVGMHELAAVPSSQSDSGCPRIRSCDGERYVILPSRPMIASRSKPLCTSERKRSSLSRSASSACLRSVMSRKWPTSPRTFGSDSRLRATTSVHTHEPSGGGCGPG